MDIIKILIAAEKVILDPASTPEQVQQAIAAVTQTGDKKALVALQQTIKYERTHPRVLPQTPPVP